MRDLGIVNVKRRELHWDVLCGTKFGFASHICAHLANIINGKVCVCECLLQRILITNKPILIRFGIDS